MASWLVEGAGDATYNGTYVEIGTDVNGIPYYSNGTRYLGATLSPYGDGNRYWSLTSLDQSSTGAWGNRDAYAPQSPSEWPDGTTYAATNGTPPAPTVSGPYTMGGYIWARVTECEDMTPMPGETVYCNGFSAVTDSNGYCVFYVPQGYYEVWWEGSKFGKVAGSVPPGFGAGFINIDCPLEEAPTPDMPDWLPPIEPPDWWPEPWPWPVIPEEPGPYNPENPWPTPEPPWEENPQPRPENPPTEPPEWWPDDPYWDEPWPWPIPGWGGVLRPERYGFSLKNPQVGW